uniref:Uncharacterized protein n=1 Tax=Oryza brachyantha TaxID=4533 RepID=J3MEV4_ORYBR
MPYRLNPLYKPRIGRQNKLVFIVEKGIGPAFWLEDKDGTRLIDFFMHMHACTAHKTQLPDPSRTEAQNFSAHQLCGPKYRPI